MIGRCFIQDDYLRITFSGVDHPFIFQIAVQDHQLVATGDEVLPDCVREPDIPTGRQVIAAFHGQWPDTIQAAFQHLHVEYIQSVSADEHFSVPLPDVAVREFREGGGHQLLAVIDP